MWLWLRRYGAFVLMIFSAGVVSYGFGALLQMIAENLKCHS